MPSALDPDLLAQLPPALRAAVEAQVQALALENAELRTRNARLEHLVRELQRARFGPRSEKLHPDQMELAFEDIEVALAAATEEQDAAAEFRTGERPARTPRGPRRMPKDLPREERVLEADHEHRGCGI